MVLSGVVLTGSGLAWAMNAWVKRESRSRVEFDLTTVPRRTVAIVPGAHVHEDGQPSTVLIDRLETARLLYVAGKVSRILHASIAYALEHRDEALDYALQFGRGLDRKKADTFVGMYVNELTLEYGERGRKALQLLLDEGFAQGILPSRVTAEFAA